MDDIVHDEKIIKDIANSVINQDVDVQDVKLDTKKLTYNMPDFSEGDLDDRVNLGLDISDIELGFDASDTGISSSKINEKSKKDDINFRKGFEEIGSGLKTIGKTIIG